MKFKAENYFRQLKDEREDEYISYDLCATIAPDVFEVTEKMVVKPNAVFSVNEEEIKEAAESCPTQVIKTDED